MHNPNWDERAICHVEHNDTQYNMKPKVFKRVSMHLPIWGGGSGVVNLHKICVAHVQLPTDNLQVEFTPNSLGAPSQPHSGVGLLIVWTMEIGVYKPL